MPLVTETYTIDEALADLEADLEETLDTLDDLDPSSDRGQALQQQASRLDYLCDGLEWHEEDWGSDAEIELGGLTAGEQALMDRESDDHAGADEMVLWFVAAGTASAPYAEDSLSATFENLADAHPAFVEWAERQINQLMSPGDSGNRLQRYFEANADGTASTTAPDSTTSSPSDSPTD